MKKYQIIESSNLILERLSLKHINQNYIKWLNNKHISRFMETRHQNHNLLSVKEYILSEESKGSLMFAINHKMENIHIGNIKIGSINYYHKSADISYFIGEHKFWGQGLASEAVKTICEFAFEKLGVVHISAGYYASNLASARVLAKCGFRVCATFHEKILTDENKREDHIFCELLRNKGT